MKISLLGSPYEVGDVTHDAPVGFVRELKKISAGKVTIKSIRDELSSIARRLEPEGFTEADLLDDETFLDNFQGMIWLVGRTYAHLPWSWEQAGDVANLAMLMSITEEVEVDDENPKALFGLEVAANPTS